MYEKLNAGKFQYLLEQHPETILCFFYIIFMHVFILISDFSNLCAPIQVSCIFVEAGSQLFLKY